MGPPLVGPCCVRLGIFLCILCTSATPQKQSISKGRASFLDHRAVSIYPSAGSLPSYSQRQRPHILLLIAVSIVTCPYFDPEIQLALTNSGTPVASTKGGRVSFRWCERAPVCGLRETAWASTGEGVVHCVFVSALSSWVCFFVCQKFSDRRMRL